MDVVDPFDSNIFLIGKIHFGMYISSLRLSIGRSIRASFQKDNKRHVREYRRGGVERRTLTGFPVIKKQQKQCCILYIYMYASAPFWVASIFFIVVYTILVRSVRHSLPSFPKLKVFGTTRLLLLTKCSSSWPELVAETWRPTGNQFEIKTLFLSLCVVLTVREFAHATTKADPVTANCKSCPFTFLVTVCV